MQLSQKVGAVVSPKHIVLFLLGLLVTGWIIFIRLFASRFENHSTGVILGMILSVIFGLLGFLAYRYLRRA